MIQLLLWFITRVSSVWHLLLEAATQYYWFLCVRKKLGKEIKINDCAEAKQFLSCGFCIYVLVFIFRTLHHVSSCIYRSSQNRTLSQQTQYFWSSKESRLVRKGWKWVCVKRGNRPKTKFRVNNKNRAASLQKFAKRAFPMELCWDRKSVV